MDIRLPTGTVTFLLTDVESSTQAREADRPATASAIAAQYEIVDAHVTAYGGVRPVEEGDGAAPSQCSRWPRTQSGPRWRSNGR